MTDRLLAFIALAGFIAFTTVMIVYVQRLDLSIVVVICLLMAAYDLLSFSFKSKNGQDGRIPPKE
jgi:hypothetical protein